MPGVSIELDRVRVAYGGHVALRELSLRAEAGRVTAVLGPSGSGKSTLLGVVAGRLQATRLQLLDMYSPVAARAGA